MVRVFRLRFISVLKNIISRFNNTLQAERETIEQGVGKFKCLQSLLTPMQHFRKIFSVNERTKNQVFSLVLLAKKQFESRYKSREFQWGDGFYG